MGSYSSVLISPLTFQGTYIHFTRTHFTMSVIIRRRYVRQTVKCTPESWRRFRKSGLSFGSSLWAIMIGSQIFVTSYIKAFKSMFGIYGRNSIYYLCILLVFFYSFDLIKIVIKMVDKAAYWLTRAECIHQLWVAHLG